MCEVWDSDEEDEWHLALERYWDYVRPENLVLEEELENLDPMEIINMNMDDWYDFLLNRYFRWRFTAPNRYATTTRHLRIYAETDTLDELYRIKEQLFLFNRENIEEGLRIARRIRGLGIAGGSGLLAILFPQYFGSVGQFVIKALREIPALNQLHNLDQMNPRGLTIANGVILIEIMRNKAGENNHLFETDFWTPRKIDKVLWACRNVR
jgi:hypothetical protein